MRFVCATALASVLALGLFAPARAQTTPFVQDENQFAIDLYGQLAREPGNFVVSPYSVSTALGMVYAGAKGQTADEIARTLHVQNMPLPAYLQAAKATVLSVQQWSDLQFHAANALWVAPQYPINPGFTAEMQADYSGNFYVTNFAHPRAAANKINDWVAGETENKIQNLVQPDMFDKTTRMALTDGAYFKASWLEKFDKAADTQSPFHAGRADDVTVPMMHMEDEFSFAKVNGAKILSIPYSGDASLFLLLPDQNGGLTQLEAGLTEARLEQWMAAMKNVQVILTLPMYTAASSFDLGDTLQAMGMTDSFNPIKADFTGISDVPDEKLYIGHVLHKTYIDVDENGTEAAAATAVIMVGVASAPPVNVGPPPPPPVIFKADHPFLYFIRSNSSGAILFMGRVDNPAAD